MSIAMALADIDAIFDRLTVTPIIVNGFDVTKKEQKEKLNRLLYTQYEGDALDIVPHCDCGELRGEFRLGRRCNNCGFTVMSITERDLESLLWIEPPAGVRALINPMVWIQLADAFTFGSFNLLEWLCNPLYKPLNNTPHPILTQIPEQWQRSLNYFHDNFDAIFDYLMSLKIMRRDEQARLELIEYIRLNRGLIFVKHLPFPSRLSFITEKTPVGTYVDTATMNVAIDAIRTISSIEFSATPVSPRRREARAAKANSQLAQYYRIFFSAILSGKPGIFRKHIFGGRTHFTGRAVISSLSENHHYQDLHLPWGMAVQIFQIHLTNKLLKRKFTPNQITRLLHESITRYSSLLDELFLELIDESPYPGLPVILQRNPSLVRGSAQLFYVVKVKTDTRINSMSMSVLSLKAPNADFDGDELNIELVLDHYMHEHMTRLAPHLGVLDLHEPRRISTNLAMQSPVVSTMNNWLISEANA